MGVKLSCNPKQCANRYAHRPELRDLGRWFYLQKNRLDKRWTRAVHALEDRECLRHVPGLGQRDRALAAHVQLHAARHAQRVLPEIAPIRRG